GRAPNPCGAPTRARDRRRCRHGRDRLARREPRGRPRRAISENGWVSRMLASGVRNKGPPSRWVQTTRSRSPAQPEASRDIVYGRPAERPEREYRRPVVVQLEQGRPRRLFELAGRRDEWF